MLTTGSSAPIRISPVHEPATCLVKSRKVGDGAAFVAICPRSRARSRGLYPPSPANSCLLAGAGSWTQSRKIVGGSLVGPHRGLPDCEVSRHCAGATSAYHGKNAVDCRDESSIRNAMTLILLTAPVTDNRQFIRVISEGVNRN
jgi:hypothetical protein